MNSLIIIIHVDDFRHIYMFTVNVFKILTQQVNHGLTCTQNVSVLYNIICSIVYYQNLLYFNEQTHNNE